MKKINIKQQIILITISIAVISVIIAVTVIVPSIKKILVLQKDINHTQQFLEEQYEKTQRMRHSLHSLDLTIEQTEKFKEAVVKEGDELQIITELEKIADNNFIQQDLRVEKINPAKTINFK